MLKHFIGHSQSLDEEAEKFSDRKLRMYSFLHENPIGVLSTITPNGDPHGVVIYFVVNKDLSISFLTKSGTRKYDNLTHKGHDRVMLTVFEPETQAVVQVTGKAVEIHDSRRLNGIAGQIWGATLGMSESGIPPLSKLEAGSFVAFDILPVQIRMAVYARPDSGGYSELFESVESFDWDEHDEPA